MREMWGGKVCNPSRVSLFAFPQGAKTKRSDEAVAFLPICTGERIDYRVKFLSYVGIPSFNPKDDVPCGADDMAVWLLPATCGFIYHSGRSQVRGEYTDYDGKAGEGQWAWARKIRSVISRLITLYSSLRRSCSNPGNAPHQFQFKSRVYAYSFK